MPSIMLLSLYSCFDSFNWFCSTEIDFV